MSRLTLAGAVFLAVLAAIPTLLNFTMKIDFNVATFFGGTSLLITVGVLLDTMRQIESHLLMRHYDGFNEARSAFYATLPVPPASSTIGGAQFTSTDVCIEIEATAVVPAQS